MTARRTILNFSVVACSALLAGGFIAYRAGAFDQWVGRKPTDHVGGTKIRQVALPDDLKAMSAEELKVMSGTKSLAPIKVSPPLDDGKVVPPAETPK